MLILRNICALIFNDESNSLVLLSLIYQILHLRYHLNLWRMYGLSLLFRLFLSFLLIYLYFNYSSIKHLILLFFILFWNHPNPMSYFHIRIYLKYIFFIINQIWFYSFPLYDLRKLVFHKNNFSLIIFLFLKIVYISYLLSKY